MGTSLENPRLWDIDRASQELSLSVAHIYKMVRENNIPFCRLGRRVMFDPADIDTWLEGCKVPTVRK